MNTQDGKKNLVSKQNSKTNKDRDKLQSYQSVGGKLDWFSSPMQQGKTAGWQPSLKPTKT